MTTKRILLAEDQVMISWIISECIKKSGNDVDVTSADNGKNALDEIMNANGNGFHLLITDIEMPEMNGIDLIKHIQKLKIDLPIIASNDQNMLKEITELGVGCIVKKPFVHSELTRQVDALCFNKS